jgi:hypothetical protein
LFTFKNIVKSILVNKKEKKFFDLNNRKKNRNRDDELREEQM